jgi:hypothetical protein
MKIISVFIFFTAIVAASSWILTGSYDNVIHGKPTSDNPAFAENREIDRSAPKDSQIRQHPLKFPTGQGGESAGNSHANTSGNYTPSDRSENERGGSSMTSSLNSFDVSSQESREQSVDLHNSRRDSVVVGTITPQMSSISSSDSPPFMVPPGARLPALFLDERSLPPPQRRVLDRIANEFIDAVATDPLGQNRALWEKARNVADTKYIKLYGHAAYNALHMQAAREAVLSQREMSSNAQP